MSKIETSRRILPAPKLRAADIAYDTLENLIVTLQIQPGAPVVEAELIEMTGHGRTPLREALLRMTANGLIKQMPRRGLIVSDIEAAEHLTLIETRRVLDQLIAQSAARLATPQQRKDLVACAKRMVAAAKKGDLSAYMQADQELDHVIHAACRNPSAVTAVIPLIIKCRRFWYAFQHEGDIVEGAKCHLQMASSVADGDPQNAAKGTNALIDYLELFARKVIDN
ncbi:GntR family transcriptional regulator [Glaciimonas soli]|uniref:FCD domain-containing protein n=1 Tax=Glaciimonas soli TaxID=2590999 RepID=A0A843YP40_9BURK|nr:GntR family transcriptional regulator [Glaciimonas soli]MQR00760.1 FCD domain-containing protein [Glaciimonas soli]